MYFMDKKEKMLLELSFPEVMSLITNRWVSQGKMPQISFLTTLVGPWGLQERGRHMSLGARLERRGDDGHVQRGGHWTRDPTLSCCWASTAR